jgi:HEPN domain-containing protein
MNNYQGYSLRHSKQNIRRRYVKKDKPYIPTPVLAKSTLEVAQQNLKASKILYDDGFYPEAIFFLQQSVEKGCKAFGFQIGLISENMASSSNIGHNTTNIYLEIIKYFEKITMDMKNNLNPIEKKVDAFDTNEAMMLQNIFSTFENEVILKNESAMKELKQELNDYAKNKKKYAKVSEEILNNLLNSLPDAEKQITKREEEIDDMNDKMIILEDKAKSSKNRKRNIFC